MSEILEEQLVGPAASTDPIEEGSTTPPVEESPVDPEPNFELKIIYDDDTTFSLRVEFYSISFIDSYFTQNRQDVHYHDNLIVQTPVTDTFSITDLFRQFHNGKTMTEVQILDRGNNNKVLYQEKNYWDTLYGIQSINGMDGVITEYQIILCHKVA